MKLTPREPTPSMVEAERAKFEEWAAAENFCVDRCYDEASGLYSGLYHRATTRWAWRAWIKRAMHDPAPSVQSVEQELLALRGLVADDAWCCTFQTLGQVRTALLKEIDAAIARAKGE